MIGSTQQQQASVQELARLVSSPQDFDQAFNVRNHVQNQDSTGQNAMLTQSQSVSNKSRVGVILEASRIFRIDNREFEFDENE